MKLSAGLFLLPLIAFGQWTEPVHVRHDLKPCISYRAKVAGEYLLVEATLDSGWKTFAMDNQKRADERLAGKKALGIDRETSIDVAGGLAVQGGWLQTAPQDFSKPELRWFTWGYQDRALFAAKVRKAGAAPAKLTVRGQACTESVCKNIDIELDVPATSKAALDVDLKPLVAVR